MKLRLNFRSLAGVELKAPSWKGKAFPVVELDVPDLEDSKALAAIVSVQAEKLVPGLKKKDLRVRITTPDGRPWDLPSFYVEDLETAARYGWGTASLLMDGKHNRWKEFAAWSE